MKYIRHLAIIGLLLCFFILYRYQSMPETFLFASENILSTMVKQIAVVIFALQFILVILQPRWFILIGLVLAISGLFNIFDGGNIIGLVFYLFAMSIGVKQGYFRNHTKTRICVSGVIFFSILCFQLRSGFEIFLESLMNIFMLLFLGICFIYMFKDNLKEYFSEKGLIDLGEYEFTRRQFDCIRGCLQKKTFQEIADEQIVSVSVIKKEMQKIYQTLQVEDRYEMFTLIERNVFLFPEESTQ